MSADKISFTQTKNLLIHACSIAGSAKNVAEFLKVEAPRISEGRDERWRLTQEQADSLISKFGQPLGAPGKFAKAIRYDSMTDFLENFELLSKQRHLGKWVSAINKPDTKQSLCDTFTLQDSSNTNKSSKQEEILSRLRRVIKTVEFQNWSNEIQEIVESQRNTNIDLNIHAIFSSLHEYLWNKSTETTSTTQKLILTLKDESLELVYGKISNLILLLYPFGYLNTQKETLFSKAMIKGTKYSISGNDNHFTENVLLKEFVITGRIIWNERANFRKTKIGSVIDKKLNLGTNEYSLPITDCANIGMSTDISRTAERYFIKADCWKSFEINVFLNSSSFYCIHIELDNDLTNFGYGSERVSLVIPRIKADKIFSELELLRGFLELEYLPTGDIKSKIAKAGGYVAGAEVL